jgi:hypothetical protein
MAAKAAAQALSTNHNGGPKREPQCLVGINNLQVGK